MRREIRRRRGRPASTRPSANGKILSYLARMAVKHEIDSKKFYNRLVEAWEREESKCDLLDIRCRKKTRDSAVFLFTVGSDVVAQFPISTTVLEGTSARAELEGYMRIFSARNPAKEIVNPKIKDHLTDIDAREVATLVPLVILALVIGLQPDTFLSYMHVSVEHLLEQVNGSAFAMGVF